MNYLDFHKDSIVIDTHNDALSHLVDESTWLPKLNLKANLENQTKYGHVDLDKLKKGSLNAAFFAVCAPEKYFSGKVLDRVLALLNAFYFNIENNSDSLKRVNGDTIEFEKILQKKEKIAAIPTLEGLDMLVESRGIELLKQLNDLGVKEMSLTWNDSNQLAEGLNSVYANGKPSEPGLTFFGENVLKKMNRLGILVDVSHLHKRSYFDVLNVTGAPVIASHSGVEGVYKHRRNFSDKELHALADNGGVIQINFASSFLCEDETAASVKKIVDHVEYAKNLIGADHVGLGSDFDGAKVPKDLKDFSGYHKITREMMNRGFLEEDIVKILAENTLRVIKEVEKQQIELTKKDYDEIKDYDEKIKTSSVGVIINGQVLGWDNIDSGFVDGFNVITFVLENNQGKEIRSTRIFYI